MAGKKMSEGLPPKVAVKVLHPSIGMRLSNFLYKSSILFTRNSQTRSISKPPHKVTADMTE